MYFGTTIYKIFQLKLILRHLIDIALQTLHANIHCLKRTFLRRRATQSFGKKMQIKMSNSRYLAWNIAKISTRIRLFYTWEMLHCYCFVVVLLLLMLLLSRCWFICRWKFLTLDEIITKITLWNWNLKYKFLALSWYYN